jgi:hypothetical protein
LLGAGGSCVTTGWEPAQLTTVRLQYQRT